MNIIVPVNGGKSFIYIPQTTSYSTIDQTHEGENQTIYTSEVDPVPGCIIIVLLILFIIGISDWDYKLTK